MYLFANAWSSEKREIRRYESERVEDQGGLKKMCCQLVYLLSVLWMLSEITALGSVSILDFDVFFMMQIFNLPN